jgi:hypothetical protein
VIEAAHGTAIFPQKGRFLPDPNFILLKAATFRIQEAARKENLIKRIPTVCSSRPVIVRARTKAPFPLLLKRLLLSEKAPKRVVQGEPLASDQASVSRGLEAFRHGRIERLIVEIAEYHHMGPPSPLLRQPPNRRTQIPRHRVSPLRALTFSSARPMSHHRAERFVQAIDNERQFKGIEFERA